MKRTRQRGSQVACTETPPFAQAESSEEPPKPFRKRPARIRGAAATAATSGAQPLTGSPLTGAIPDCSALRAAPSPSLPNLDLGFNERAPSIDFVMQQQLASGCLSNGCLSALPLSRSVSLDEDGIFSKASSNAANQAFAFGLSPCISHGASPLTMSTNDSPWHSEGRMPSYDLSVASCQEFADDIDSNGVSLLCPPTDGSVSSATTNARSPHIWDVSPLINIKGNPRPAPTSSSLTYWGSRS